MSGPQPSTAIVVPPAFEAAAMRRRRPRPGPGRRRPSHSAAASSRASRAATSRAYGVAARDPTTATARTRAAPRRVRAPRAPAADPQSFAAAADSARRPDRIGRMPALAGGVEQRCGGLAAPPRRRIEPSASGRRPRSRLRAERSARVCSRSVLEYGRRARTRNAWQGREGDRALKVHGRPPARRRDRGSPESEEARPRLHRQQRPDPSVLIIGVPVSLAANTCGLRGACAAYENPAPFRAVSRRPPATSHAVRALLGIS